MYIGFFLCRRSVCVSRRRQTKGNHASTDSIQESAESMQESEGSIQESAESMQEPEGSIQESAESMQASEGESAESAQSSQEDMEVCTEENIQGYTGNIQESAKSIQECTEDIQEGPMYTLMRVNRFLEPLSGETPLQDKGIYLYGLMTVYLDNFTFLCVKCHL